MQQFKRLRRTLGRPTNRVTEARGLVEDVTRHTYWQWRHRTGHASGKAKQRFSWGVPPSSGERPKNVLWIMLDALRQDIFDEYLRRGGLGDLAPQSAYLPHTFAQGSWTYPSVFSFLTGRYPFNCGVSRIAQQGGVPVSLCADFDESCPTIFTVLREHGYQAASILDGWGYTIRTTAGQAHREDRYFEENWGWIYGQGRRYLSLPELRDASLGYVERAANQAPFLLFVRSLHTHSPYRGIFKSADYVTKMSRRRWSFRLVEGFLRGLHDFEAIYLTPLLARLEQIGQLDNTIVILHSDHGEMLWDLEEDLRPDPQDEEMWRHQLEPYNALIKVPLFIWGAKMQGTYPDSFRLVDLVPTLLDELGIPYDAAQFDGVTLREADPRPLYADSAGNGQGGIAYWASGPKLLMSHRLGVAAYQVGRDDYERLALRRDARSEVDRFLQFVQQTSRSPQQLGEDREDDADTLTRRLQALGYLE